LRALELPLAVAKALSEKMVRSKKKEWRCILFDIKEIASQNTMRKSGVMMFASRCVEAFYMMLPMITPAPGKSRGR
jgi:hypothetical protein